MLPAVNFFHFRKNFFFRLYCIYCITGFAFKYNSFLTVKISKCSMCVFIESFRLEWTWFYYNRLIDDEQVKKGAVWKKKSNQSSDGKKIYNKNGKITINILVKQTKRTWSLKEFKIKIKWNVVFQLNFREIPDIFWFMTNDAMVLLNFVLNLRFYWKMWEFFCYFMWTARRIPQY